MTEEKIFTRRDFGKVTIASSLMGAFGCKKHHRRRKRLPLLEPLVRDFKNEKEAYDGRVYYTLMASDPDGMVMRISTRYNDESFEDHPGSQVTVSKAIAREGKNVFQAIAYDDQGKDSLPREDVFEVPTKMQAFEYIKGMLDESLEMKEFLGYETNASFFLDDQEVFADFFLTRRDNSYAVVHYAPVGTPHDLERELANRALVNDFKIHHQYFFRLPIDEVHRAMEAFIQNRYTTDFKE